MNPRFPGTFDDRLKPAAISSYLLQNSAPPPSQTMFSPTPFHQWTTPLSNEHKSNASLSFLLLGYLDQKDSWLRLVCTSKGWKNLVTLRAHVAFVHQAARPWRSSGNDHYAHWSKMGYAWGVGLLRWSNLRKDLLISPPKDRQCVRLKQSEIDLDRFYKDHEQLPGLPIILTDLTETWSSCPTKKKKKKKKSEEEEEEEEEENNSDEQNLDKQISSSSSSSTTTWTMKHFLERFSDEWFRFDDLHGEEMSFLDYYVYSSVVTRDDSPLALYDSQFGEFEDEPENESEADEDDNKDEGGGEGGGGKHQVSPRADLVSEYDVPAFFRDDMFSIVTTADINDLPTTTDNLLRPPFRWVLIGPERSGAFFSFFFLSFAVVASFSLSLSLSVCLSLSLLSFSLSPIVLTTIHRHGSPH